VRWAAPGGEFGAAIRLASVKRGWTPSVLTAAISPAGDAIVAWQEETDEDPERFGNVCGSPCHARVRAASAPAGGAFGSPAVVSALGTANLGSSVLAAIAPDGKRLVAWHADGLDRPGRAVIARAAPGQDPPAGTDTRAPRVALAASVRDLRAATRHGRLQLKLGCDERCAIAATVLSRADDEQLDLDDLPTVVVRRTQRVAWTLSARQRRTLTRLLREGRVRLTVHAVDAAGNKRYRYLTPAN
jgi:hypothetical protein